MSKKIVVPEEMLKATDNMNFHFQREERRRLIEAALCWLSEHPIVPTDEQIEAFETRPVSTTEWSRRWAVEWQRIMFRAPGPEVPDEIKELLVDFRVGGVAYNAVLAAYRCGQKYKSVVQ